MKFSPHGTPHLIPLVFVG